VVTPFPIAVDPEAWRDLRGRLERTRWPDAIAGSGWERGADLTYVRELARYWRESFDPRRWESELGRFAHFRTSVEGLGIHFLHARGHGPRPFPLVVIHGWPGSFLEMLDLIPRLCDPAAHGGSAEDAFDVVVPSLPGYGFSDRPAAAGFSNARTADLLATLMGRLGYERFGAQGGDWGAGVATWMALRHPGRLGGIHLNYVPGSYRPHVGPHDAPLTDAERAFEAESGRWYAEEGAYAHLQATRPQTAAFALADSPAGLLAWIVEKFRDWSDCGGDVESRFSKDKLLDNVTLYWMTETIHSSMRFYYESKRTPLRLAPGERVGVPCALARFPAEAPSPPREWVARGYDLRRWTEMPRGGHFAAMEEPDLLAQDIRAFFRALR
jgi:pimeloyl-ACP methyl ester carboxylesterase